MKMNPAQWMIYDNSTNLMLDMCSEYDCHEMGYIGRRYFHMPSMVMWLVKYNCYIRKFICWVQSCGDMITV